MEVIPNSLGARPTPRVIIVPLEQGGEPIFRNGMASVLAKDEHVDADTQTADVPVWRDDLPSVSFDIALGKKYQTVDFDVDEFTAMADEYGMDDDARRRLNIHINGSGDRFRAGYFSPSDKHIEVYKRRKVKQANKVLAHELKHAADDAEGILGKQHLRYMIGIIGSRTSLYASMGVNARSIASIFLDIPPIFTVGALSAYFISQAASIGGYRLHPDERRAFKAEKRHRPILNFVERKEVEEKTETIENSTT